MKSNLQKIFYDNFVVNLLIAIFLSHIFYKVTFIDRVKGEFELIDQLKSGSVISTQFYVESPIFTMLGLVFRIDNFDVYLLFVYLFSLVLLFLIVFNLKFLGSYSTFFLLTGWVVTISWFMGHVDVLSVLLILLISKLTLENSVDQKKLVIFYFLLTVNHNAIAFVCFFVLLVLIERIKRKSFLIYSLVGQVVGNILISFYLNRINFSGRGRLRFVFNDNVILDSINFVSENIFIVIWSGFMSLLILQIVFSITNGWDLNKKFIISTFICIFFTCIALDTSRIFSLAVIPISIYSISSFNKSLFIKENLSYFYIFTFISTLLIGPRFVHGMVLTNSPNNSIESFYNLIPRIVNSLMSGIWS